MGVHRLNHAVLYVRDVNRSVAFYRETLGFRPIEGMDGLRGAAFLKAPGSNNDHDLALFEIGSQANDSPAGRTAVGLYHLAWEVDTLGELERLQHRLAEAGALAGA
ncbi:MAG: VOC family protein, partial [Propionibacteriales bacterium]|nr:VOC family protein [Propionibacteriales bacterium]